MMSLSPLSVKRLQPTAAVLALALLLSLFASHAAAAQFTVLHTFSGADGQFPYPGVVIDRRGNLYGTTQYGGSADHGAVFRLSPSGSGWVLTVLYSFQGGNDGAYPYGNVTIGPDGALYGATTGGGGSGCGYGCGTLFRLSPPATACKTATCGWNETMLYRFTGGDDGRYPASAPVFDQAGNLYGTTIIGGQSDAGAVYELSPSSGGWIQSVIYSFSGANDGNESYSGLTFDRAGNMYGTTILGGIFGGGTVYELTPGGSGWTQSVLYSFTGGADGGSPYGNVMFDGAGNMYGMASTGGALPAGGTAFEMTPTGGGWSYSVLYDFTQTNDGGEDPHDGFVMDSNGILYANADAGGIPPQNDGTVFKLTPSSGSWTYTSYHEFTGGDDGFDPFGPLTFGSDGNLYGTARFGGANGAGVIFMVTP